MATNVYFNNFAYAREQDLVEDLTIESIKIYGHNVKYLPKTISGIDHLFGEDKLLKYETAADVEMYIKNVEGFEGEGEFMSKFGVQLNDQLTLTVARKRFDQIRTEKLTTVVLSFSGFILASISSHKAASTPAVWVIPFSR